MSSTHHLASATGMAVIERGGNAFDAAVAGAFVLQVVEPHFNGPGGDASILAHSASTGVTRSICGQGSMPAGADIARMRTLGLVQMPGSGLLSATVPGAFGALLALLSEFGTMRLSEVLSYAVGYARHGYPLLPAVANAVAVLAPLFRTEWLGSGQVYLRNGRVPAAGSRFTNPILADTYEHIIREAEAVTADRDGQIEAAHRIFYQGFVAEAIDRFVTTPAVDSTGRRHSGFLTGEDLARWQPLVEDALTADYRGQRVYKPGPWSQGPVFLQQLALLEGFDLAGMGFGSAEFIHTVVECANLAFADREAWYGDPEHSDVPMATLLSAEYNRERRRLVGKEAARLLRPGSPDGRTPWTPEIVVPSIDPAANEWLTQLGDGLPTVVQATAARGDTCFLSATDRAGNVAAVTPSGGWLKSSPTMPELGFALGTRGQTMWLAEGHPNSLAPGRRPRTTLSPTIVLGDDGRRLGFGTPGGDRQDQWTLQFFLAVTEFGLDTQAATEALAFQSDAPPSSFTPRESREGGLTVESSADAAVIDELRLRGHDVVLAPPLSQGKVCATGADETGFVLAAASPRGRQAYAAAR
ncbi:gamma-glutamyltransferase family protein [Actinoplanes siamensis]|uniref:gamma-glutamyltransferase family protein n=1 Tax=Actinoplanes siamensis TaxID=1223317 RepID=UPI001EF28F4D|nr:gamma-glutamyltransferase [Actinoplanes siamensis]